MTCRGCGPSPDPEQDREHNDWCPDNPRSTHGGKDDAVALRAENERLRAALADAAAVMSSIYESFRDGEKIDPAVVDIGIGCWLEKHAPGSLPEKDAVVPEEERLLAELAGLGTGVSTDDSAHRMEQILPAPAS
jgi:hypothetical protein